MLTIKNTNKVINKCIDKDKEYLIQNIEELQECYKIHILITGYTPITILLDRVSAISGPITNQSYYKLHLRNPIKSHILVNGNRIDTIDKFMKTILDFIQNLQQ